MATTMKSRLARHAKNLHDDTPDETCPLCQVAAEESARLRRESQEKKAKTPKLDPRAESITNDWKSGTTLAHLKSRTGLSRSALRRLITISVGGKAKFNELRKAGAGGARVKGNRKAENVAGRAGRAGNDRQADDYFIITVDDSKVPVIRSAKRSDGWKYDRMKIGLDSEGHGIFTSVYTSPDGTSYVQARATETCDLIYHFDENHRSYGIPNMRLRKLDESSKVQRSQKVEQKLEAIAAAATTRRKAKRARRKAA